MRGLLALGLGVLFAAGVAPGGDAKTDSAKLQGKWVSEVKGMKLELGFAKDTFTLTFDGKHTFKGTVKLDPKKKPKEMDMTITEGPGGGKNEIALCIYEFAGDTLKWCGSSPGTPTRPKEFPAKDDDPKVLNATFKRVK